LGYNDVVDHLKTLLQRRNNGGVKKTKGKKADSSSKPSELELEQCKKIVEMLVNDMKNRLTINDDIIEALNLFNDSELSSQYLNIVSAENPHKSPTVQYLTSLFASMTCNL